MLVMFYWLIDALIGTNKKHTFQEKLVLLDVQTKQEGKKGEKNMFFILYILNYIFSLSIFTSHNCSIFSHIECSNARVRSF